VQGVTIHGATRSGSRRREQAAGPAQRRSSVPLWPPPRDAWIAVAGVVLIYAAHVFYGALVSDASLVMDIAAALLVGGALAFPRLRQDLSRLKGLVLPAALFAAVILVALWTLTPFTPGGPHPVWAYVGAPAGASTIDKSATLIEIVKLLGLACLFVAGLAAGARDDRARYAVQLTIILGVAFGLWAFFGASSGMLYSTGGRRLEGDFLNPIDADRPAVRVGQGGVGVAVAAGELGVAVDHGLVGVEDGGQQQRVEEVAGAAADARDVEHEVERQAGDLADAGRRPRRSLGGRLRLGHGATVERVGRGEEAPPAGGA
jgi:hypothetical protein